MANEGEAGSTQTGHRATGIALIVGIALIGFTRLEDRAIIGMPDSNASANAALAIPSSDSTDDGSFADDPDGVVRVSNATRLPRNRIRRILRDRDASNVATRSINPAISAPPGTGTSGSPIDAATAAVAAEAFSPATPTTPLAFTGFGPALGPTATPVFSASVPGSSGAGVTSGGGSGGGTSGGGGSTGGTGGVPVTAVPEPSTWITLILGLFGIGSALRRRSWLSKSQFANAS